MPDREKIVEDLVDVYKLLTPSKIDSNDNADFLLKYRAKVSNALAFLQAQEPVKPVPPITADDPWWNCASCGGVIETDQYRFCPWCGKALKWD